MAVAMVLYLKTIKMKTIIAMKKLTTNQKQLIAFGVLFISLMIFLIKSGLLK